MVFVALSANNWYQWGKTASEAQLDARYAELMQKPNLTDEEWEELRGFWRAAECGVKPPLKSGDIIAFSDGPGFNMFATNEELAS